MLTVTKPRLSYVICYVFHKLFQFAAQHLCILYALVWTVQCSDNLCHIVGPPLSTPLVLPPPPPPPPQASRPQHNAQPQTGDSIGQFSCFGNLILI